eukprot:TRINITY_DN8562_c0_g4_i1.p1 TRINITY_DN8562_c0_g4~~TRINITY_DN8562_c0_g4_i1.p1  ORF type:complete len:248 (+),score=19.65 TRINITY_DN8562_c0_g4_i1:87-830(+)
MACVGEDRACQHGCGLSAFGRHTTCCTTCKGPDGPHAGDCSAKNKRVRPACSKGCGRPAFGSFSTCCTRCKGTAHGHADDCTEKCIKGACPKKPEKPEKMPVVQGHVVQPDPSQAFAHAHGSRPPHAIPAQPMHAPCAYASPGAYASPTDPYPYAGSPVGGPAPGGYAPYAPGAYAPQYGGGGAPGAYAPQYGGGGAPGAYAPQYGGGGAPVGATGGAPSGISPGMAMAGAGLAGLAGGIILGEIFD